MKSLFKKLSITFKLAITFCFFSLLIANAAFAQIPENIQGTTWKDYWHGTVTGGGLTDYDLSIRVTDQQPINKGQESKCYFISGDMDLDIRTGKEYGYLSGFYCPDRVTEEAYKQGTIAFVLRRGEVDPQNPGVINTGDREPLQVYKGEIIKNDKGMDVMKGKLLYISGDWGEYDFSVTKMP